MSNSPSTASVIFTALITSILTAAGTVVIMLKFNLVAGPEKVTVPNVIGLTQADAQTNLQAHDLVLIIGGRKASRTAVPGTVVEQNPTPGTKVDKAATLTVVLAGEAPSVPDLKNRTIAEATVLLEQSGFKIQVGEAVPHDSIAEGKIASQVPGAGMAYENGRSVVVKTSSGPATVAVPKLTGLYLKQAKKAIQEAGFKVGKTQWQYNDNFDAYKVLKQIPAFGQKAKPGSAIDLVANEE